MVFWICGRKSLRSYPFESLVLSSLEPTKNMARYYDLKGDPNEDLILSEDFPNCVSVEYVPPLEKLQESLLGGKKKEDRVKFKKELLYINGQDNFLSIFPINTRSGHAEFLAPKYGRIKSITLDGFGFDTPDTIDEVMSVLEEMPSAFTKDYEYGLGLAKDYRFIIDAVEQIPEVEDIVISKKESTGIQEYGFVFSFEDFEGLRKGLNRITGNYRKEAYQEKLLFVHNSILFKLNPEKYPEKRKALKKDVIVKLVNTTSCDEATSPTDASALVDLVSRNQKTIHKTSRRKVLDLKQDIELLNLEWLIAEVDKLLGKKSSEENWQTLLVDNPYILSLVFGYPILNVHGQASVGGRKFTGSGDKVTDFLVKNRLTNNAAIVEIKKPSTKLLRGSEYRSGVYAPSSELAGSIGQVLDQKYKLQKDIASIKDNSGVYDVESYAVDCVLIIGTTPVERDQLKSFELARWNSRDVNIFTFDELATKLKDIHSILKPSRGIAPTPDSTETQ